MAPNALQAAEQASVEERSKEVQDLVHKAGQLVSRFDKRLKDGNLRLV